MRVIDLPGPGRFSGSATLRKEVVRAISFCEKAVRVCPDQKPMILKTMSEFMDHAMARIAELEAMYDSAEPKTTETNPTDEDKGEEKDQEKPQDEPEVKLPSILRKRKNK